MQKRPSLADLAAWHANEVTIWIIAQLNQSFPDPKSQLPIKNQESALMLNYYAGARAILDKIKQLCS